ncbi:MAG TPA: EAL domain-containing protein [Solirubrobacteraceae bacterium]|jgi:EAL domain-containing protein (putative c-di-GMP-specific phosphodiesterase class I)
MGTSTSARAKPRLLMGFPVRAPHNRYRAVAGADSRAQRICSPAGLHRRPWLARLRRALERDLFVLHYQPIVSLADGRVAHHEALVRLADEPDGNVVGPASFLPAAERYGLISQIDRMVLDKVAALLGSDSDGQGGGIAMNLSALSLTDDDMLAHVQRGLDRHGADPTRLILEVTETASISDMARARAFCAGAQQLGCAVALDDFGAGFGSFHYLKHLPFNYLKIDGAFIRGLPESAHDQLVVKALVGLVREMGQRTIAEFVGDRETLRLLRQFGVDYAQGFKVGRPAPALVA